KTVPKLFWNEHSARISQNLWLPSLDLIEREWSGEFVSKGRGTSLRKSARDQVRWTTRRKDQQKNTDNEQVHREQPNKVRRFRVYPSKKQKETLRKWFGTARWTYNQCLDAVEEKESVRTKKDLRAAFPNKEAINKMGKPWDLETPYDIRDAAMDDFLKAYDSAHARYKKDNKVFKIKHRSRTKSRRESIVIHHKHWSHGRGPYAFLRKMNSAEPLPRSCRTTADMCTKGPQATTIFVCR
ncbi:hypothetical protein V1504DRAFT_485779, partial [Lipomyces starkeyi]